MNTKKLFAVLVAVLMSGVAGTTFAGDRHYDRHDGYRGDYGHRGNDYRGGGHHHGGRDFLLGAIIGGVITGAVINAQQRGYYQQQCWMEQRRDAYGNPVMVQVCAQN